MPKNPREAERRYRLAAGHENAQAQTNLGTMYAEGCGGLPRTMREAGGCGGLRPSSTETRQRVR